MVLSSRDLTAQGFQLEGDSVVACQGRGLSNILHASQQWLEAHLHTVNGLNVFPVPDGDTGTNMVLTLRAALKEVAGVTDKDHAGAVAAAAAYGALMGGRGNSGVILSQLLEGLAVGLAGRVTFTAADFAHASQAGVDKAYQSVVRPVEGTILTVARQAAEAAQQSARSSRDLVMLFKHMVEAARIAQARTPDLLPILKEAGVTDSGGQGLLYVLEGALRFLTHEPVDADVAGETVPILQSTLGAETEQYGYDVQFLIQGHSLDVEQIRAQIDSLGWSTVVIGNEHIVKVHLHASDPGLPLNYGASQGILSGVVVENMENQARRFVREHAVNGTGTSASSHKPDRVAAIGTVANTAIVSVAPGPGLARVFHSLGVSETVSGGPTMNPSPGELLAAIRRTGAENVLLLPNNDNVILAARQAQALSARNVRVVPTRTIPQGMAALLAFNYQADLETNARRMLEEAEKVQTVEIARAARQTTLNGLWVQPGDVVGLLNDTLLSVGQDCNEVALDVLSRLGIGCLPIPKNGAENLSSAPGDLLSGWVEQIEPEIATIYYGQEVLAAQAQTLAAEIRRLCPELKIEVLDGGQPHYHYIISLE